mmetsp:Transcript_9682/g.11287  ORF Transcript_9682/g.11287 Transcript_9682/m.11287 type:complete len:228 (+) Transcript_9682:57-740(+)
MPVSDIVYIISTVAITQAICDGFANKFIFQSDAYKQRCATLERARIKRDKTIAQAAQNPITGNSNSSVKAKEKQVKKVQRANEDFHVAASNVSQKHMIPNFLTVLVFFILYKVLNLEYQGKIVAVLPFTPWRFFQRFTMRGISFDPDFVFEGSSRVQNPEQACGFLFIYMMCSVVKFMVKSVISGSPPQGAEKGFFQMLDDPRGQKFLKSLGVDMEEINEIRKVSLL